MAMLPSAQYAIQQSDGIVRLFELGSEDLIAEFNPSDIDTVLKAQKVIYDSNLSDGDKSFAHFWSGYFYANAR